MIGLLPLTGHDLSQNRTDAIKPAFSKIIAKAFLYDPNNSKELFGDDFEN